MSYLGSASLQALFLISTVAEVWVLGDVAYEDSESFPMNLFLHTEKVSFLFLGDSNLFWWLVQTMICALITLDGGLKFFWQQTFKRK